MEKNLKDESNDTCLTVEDVISRTHGHIANTEPIAATIELGDLNIDVSVQANTLDVHLGRGKREKHPTTRYGMNTNWNGH